MLVCAPREALRTSCCRRGVQKQRSSSHGLGKPAALSTFVSSTRPAPVREDTTVCFSAARGRLRYPFHGRILKIKQSRVWKPEQEWLALPERSDRYRMGDCGARIPPAAPPRSAPKTNHHPSFQRRHGKLRSVMGGCGFCQTTDALKMKRLPCYFLPVVPVTPKSAPVIFLEEFR
jgi:hypothetical protein